VRQRDAEIVLFASKNTIKKKKRCMNSVIPHVALHRSQISINANLRLG
jgi:hypothetical protein